MGKKTQRGKHERLSGPLSGDAPGPRVLIAIATYAAFQRQMVEGIARFADAYAPQWEFEFQIRLDSLLLHVEDATQYDAVIGYVPHHEPRILAVLRRRSMPVVLIEEDEYREFPVVRGDNRAIGEMAFEHLRGKAFRRFAYLGGDFPGFIERRESFFAAVRAAGLEAVESPMLNFALNRPLHEPWVGQWIAQIPKPVAMFAGSISSARRVVEVCREMGILVPEEVAVLGVDNESLISELSRPRISTIDHGMERAGFEAAALLHRMLAGEAAPAEPILVPPLGVIERQSSDTLAVDDPDVRAAVRLIREQATAGLSIKHLLASLPATRRRIEMGFREHLGRSIHQEITRVRLERAKALLETTEMSMPQITASSGFQYPSRLSEVFLQVVGMTPTAYRRQRRRTQHPRPGTGNR